MSKNKILITEDEKSLSSALKQRFEKEGFEVEVAEDGEICLEKVHEFGPDIILLDLLMPKVKGEEVLEKLQENEETSQIPVIVLTNLSEMKNISEVMDRGVYDYLIKSDEPLEHIVEKVKSKLSN